MCLTYIHYTYVHSLVLLHGEVATRLVSPLPSPLSSELNLLSEMDDDARTCLHAAACGG